MPDGRGRVSVWMQRGAEAPAEGSGFPRSETDKHTESRADEGCGRPRVPTSPRIVLAAGNSWQGSSENTCEASPGLLQVKRRGRRQLGELVSDGGLSE